MSLVDTHCHLFLEPLCHDLDGVIARARAAGVTQVIVPAFDHASWSTISTLAHREGLFFAYGLHPWVSNEPLDVVQLRRLFDQQHVVAVGEIGLDAKIERPSLTQQTEVLCIQLRLARDLDLPIILHCRGAFEPLLAILQDYAPGLRGVLHAYAKGPALGQRFLDLGLHLALGGAITRPRARRARSSALALPLERLLLETDAPSIGLEGVEPAQVEPKHVAEIARQLAQLRATSPEQITQRTTENARALFHLS